MTGDERTARAVTSGRFQPDTPAKGVPAAMDQSTDPARLWTGPTCVMCNGSGQARFIPRSGIPYYLYCPACNGHGREPE